MSGGFIRWSMAIGRLPKGRVRPWMAALSFRHSGYFFSAWGWPADLRIRRASTRCRPSAGVTGTRNFAHERRRSCATMGPHQRRWCTKPIPIIFSFMLRRLGSATRLSLAILILSWLLLQTVLTVLGHAPGMLDIGRAFTQAMLVVTPLCIGLMLTLFPDADVPPKKLETLLMVAAFGFASAVVLRWAFGIGRSADTVPALAASA